MTRLGCKNSWFVATLAEKPNCCNARAIAAALLSLEDIQMSMSPVLRGWP
jgi:hypothetical protein